MTRSKVKLQFISNNSVRKATYRKRKRGFLKKMDEVNILCGVESCAIMYDENEPQPVVTPSVNEARRIIERFRNLSEIEQNKRMVNQESFSKQMLEKIEEKLMKQMRENREKEITRKMFQSMSIHPIAVTSNLAAKECDEVAKMFDQSITEMDMIMEKLQAEASTSSNPPAPRV